LSKAANAHFCFHPINAITLTGGHIDDAQHGIGSIKRGGRTADHLDALDQVQVYRETMTHEDAANGAFIDPHTVDQAEHPAAQITWVTQAPNTDILVVMVVCHVEAAQTGEHLCHGPVPVGLDFLTRDDRNGRRGFLGLLHVLGGSVNDTHFHEVIQGKLCVIGQFFGKNQLGCHKSDNQKNRQQLPSGPPTP